MRFLKRNILLAIVFITGFCVLVIEVAALRILSPYFGNTIYSASSVIGVVLAALSIGYYAGGKISDWRSSEQIFFGLIGLSGVSVLAIGVLMTSVLPSIGHEFSITSGPLIASMLLFFIPAVILGTLSPYVIALRHARIKSEGVGSIAGAVFFWSTLGSIAGSLASGFVLIPHIGLASIVGFVGTLLVSIGIVGFLFYRGAKKAGGMIFIVSAILLANIKSGDVFANVPVVYSADGIYEKIVIYDASYNQKPTRILLQDMSFSAAMYHDSDDLVFDYTKYFEVYKLFNDDIDRALVIGGGAYSVPKALLAADDDVIVDVAEIEPSLYELSKKYFRVPDDPRLVNHITDGRRFLHDTETRYDVIFGDAYQSVYSIPSHLTTREFYELVSSRLSETGVFVGNFIVSLAREEPSFFLSELATIADVFSYVTVVAVDDPASLRPQNTMIIASNATPAPRNYSGDSAGSILQTLAAYEVPVSRYAPITHKLLTDDHAPVDYMVSRLLGKIEWESEPLVVGDQMIALVSQMQALGPSHTGSEGSRKTADFIEEEASLFADTVSRQTWEYQGTNGSVMPINTIVARFDSENPRRIVVGTHFDTKRHAHNDPAYPDLPVPGANDGSSGVAVLLEIARSLAVSGKKPPVGVDIVFFDGEEGDPALGGDYTDWTPLGSSYFVDHLDEYYEVPPENVVVLDMVCDKDLTISKEALSHQRAPDLTNALWAIGARIAPEAFIPEVGAPVSDDHTPFLEAGIPAALIIDFDYPSFHTTEDTIDKCSSKSMKAVGDVVWEWIVQYQ